MRRLVVSVLVLVGCSGKGPQLLGASARPRAMGSAVGPITLAPSGEAAIRYNESPPAVPHTPLNDAVSAAVRDAAARAGVAAPVPDARLFRACTELAEIVPEDGPLVYALTEFALLRNGIIEPSPRMLIAWGDIDSPESVVKQLQPRLAEFLGEGTPARLGVGAARRKPDGTSAVVFALQDSAVSTSPIPRAVAAGGSVVIDAVVDPRYREPEVFVTRSDGSIERLELKPGRPGGFVTRLSCGSHGGRQQIEIAASDAAGSTVLANFPVWCGAEPPQTVTVDPGRDDIPVATPEQAEHRLLANLNRDRTAAGLPILLWDDRLAAVARSHSEEMHRTQVVAHISPTTGSAADRVRVANIKTGVVLENVARAYGINEAHDGLMNSPGHRANIMSSVATHIGIGVTFGEEISGRRELFITQVFRRVPPKIDTPRAVATVQHKLSAARRSLVNSSQLGALAQRLADALAAGKSRDDAYSMIKRQIDDFGRRYLRVGTVMTATADLETTDGGDLLGDSSASDVGVGVAQGSHPEIGDGAIWIVVLLADRR
jgi:uncharacterized protein YkwD